MNTTERMAGESVCRYIRQLHLRNPRTPKTYQRILSGFHHFVAEHSVGQAISVEVIQNWLRDRITVWPPPVVLHHGRLMDRFLDWMVSTGSLQGNPLAELRKEYSQSTTAPILRALLNPDSAGALEALRPQPRFESFLGGVMQNHIILMRSAGHRYNTEEVRLLRFDRFLQGRPDLRSQPLNVLVREWTNAAPSAQNAWECNQTCRVLSKALRRLDPTIKLVPSDGDLEMRARRRHRQPYIYTENEVSRMLEAARTFSFAAIATSATDPLHHAGVNVLRRASPR